MYTSINLYNYKRSALIVCFVVCCIFSQFNPKKFFNFFKAKLTKICEYILKCNQSSILKINYEHFKNEICLAKS